MFPTSSQCQTWVLNSKILCRSQFLVPNLILLFVQLLRKCRSWLQLLLQLLLLPVFLQRCKVVVLNLAIGASLVIILRKTTSLPSVPLLPINYVHICVSVLRLVNKVLVICKGSCNLNLVFMSLHVNVSSKVLTMSLVKGLYNKPLIIVVKMVTSKNTAL